MFTCAERIVKRKMKITPVTFFFCKIFAPQQQQPTANNNHKKTSQTHTHTHTYLDKIISPSLSDNEPLLFVNNNSDFIVFF